LIEEPAAERLVRHLAHRGIRDPRVLAAIRDVPRQAFVPGNCARDAWLDEALPLGSGQTVSQPYVVALMTEALELEASSKVLEVGTGSGYQAAVISRIAPQVFTIEILPVLAESACERLARLGYCTVRCRQGDGAEGWPEEAPFEAIVVTAAPKRVPQALVDQLAVGGRLCVPVGEDPSDQRLLLFVKRPDGGLDGHALAPVRFVPMTGAAP